MRKYSILIVSLAASVFVAGCDTFPQPVRAEPAPRMTSPPAQIASAEPDRRQVELANLRADIQVLDRKVRELGIALEEVTRQNQRLVNELEQERRQGNRLAGYVQQAQLERVAADLERMAKAADAEQRQNLLREVTAQIEALGKQTQAAIDALARNVSSRPVTTPSGPVFSDDFPKEGISYTVKSGDTLSSIASRYNSTVRDIRNANRIENPSALQIGQTLFIPQK